jgi:hypothetical protein
MLAYSSLFWQIRSYYGISRNLLIKFKDDQIDETSILAQVLSSEAAISSLLDMSIRSLPGDHGLPLQQVFLFPADLNVLDLLIKPEIATLKDFI